MYRGGVNGRNERRSRDAALPSDNPAAFQAANQAAQARIRRDGVDERRRRADEIMEQLDIDFSDAARQQQSEASVNRIKAIENRYWPVMNADIMLLAGLHHDDPINRPQGLAEFMQTNNFRDQSPLGELFKVMVEKLPASTLADVQKTIYSDDWVNSPKFLKHRNDYPQWGDGNRYHPRFKLWYLSYLGQSQAWTTAIASANGPTWKKLFQAINYLDHLSVLKRFVDDRNPETASRPHPDGSNLQDADLKVSWVLHRQFLRTLHYRSLYFRDKPHGIIELEQINYISLLLYHNELQSVPLQDRSRHVPEDFKFVWDFYDDLEEMLQNVAKALFVEDRFNPLQYPFEQTVSRNIDDSVKFEGIVNQYLYYGNKAQEWQLWAHLAQITEDFDDRMDLEHVEDVLIERRIVVPDEEYEVAETLAQRGVYCQKSDIYSMDMSTTQDLVESRLRKIGQGNRYRRNHLLLKDWNKKRPWRQLYYIYDTSDNGKPYRGYIAQFYAYGSFLESFPSRPFNSNSPSRTAGIFDGIYPIQPMASHGKDKPNIPQPHLRYFEDGCSICRDPFEQGQTIVQLFCDHLYHYTCVRGYWDGEKHYRMDCPNRCPVQSWKLDEVADITPEVFDVWDNARVTDERTALAEPDLNHEYADMEGHLRHASNIWGWYQNPDETWHKDETLPRSVLVEMVHLRSRRNLRNRERRKQYDVPAFGMQQYQADTLN